jgi:drug/metabolite transporter (DMT)-like permease
MPVSTKKIYTLMVMTAFFWSGAFIAGKLSSHYIPAFTLTFLRFFFATILIYFIAIKNPLQLKKLERQDIPVFLFTGLIGMFGYHVFFFNALKYTTAINSSLIGASNPILTTLLCVIFLKEKLSKKRIFGIILSFTGVFLTITGVNPSNLGHLSFNHGDLLMALAVVFWASYSVFSKKVGPSYTPFTLTFYSFLFCTIALIPFVIYEAPWRLVPTIPYYSYIAVLYMSIFASVIGYLVQQIAIKQIGPSKTSIFINLVPVFSIILSVIILGETLSIIKLITAAIIICGVYITQKN